MKIIVVVENEDGSRLSGEFGLSLMVETPDVSFLVDTGATSLVLTNLMKEGYSPEDIPFAVISHNHRDHIGGLLPFLEKNTEAKVYVSENLPGEYVKYKQGVFDILSDNYAYYTMHERFTEISDMQIIAKNIAVCHVAYPDPKYICKDPYLMQIVDGLTVRDDFSHEVYVTVIDGKHYNIISPCSHNGIINIINDAKQRFPNRKLKAFIGGLHLQGSDDELANYTTEEIEALADMLNDTELEALYTCHCTGRSAAGILKRRCKFPVEYIITGSEINI